MRAPTALLLALLHLGSTASAQTDPEPATPPATPNVPEPPHVDETPGATEPGATHPPAPQASPTPAPAARRGPRRDPTARMFSRADDRAERERLRTPAGRRRAPGDPEVLELEGMPDQYFYRARTRGRARVFVYLHSRGANPREACRRFSTVVTRFGWLLCPVGPGDRGEGRRVWNNNATLARRYSVAGVEALARRFNRRVRWNDHVMMGFSEGAFVAMQTGLAEPGRFPRWVIFAAHDGYIDMNRELYPAARRALRKVYLITGAHDEIVARTRRAHDLMRRERLGRVQMRILPGAAHELPPAFDAEVRRALQFVTR